MIRGVSLPAHLTTTREGWVVDITKVQPQDGGGLAGRAGVLVAVEIRATDETRRLADETRDAFMAWATERAAGRPHAEHPPREFAEFLFELPVTLTDDVGTAYLLRTRSAGGSTTEHLGTCLFLPLPPPAATALTVGFDGAPRATIGRQTTEPWPLEAAPVVGDLD